MNKPKKSRNTKNKNMSHMKKENKLMNTNIK